MLYSAVAVAALAGSTLVGAAPVLNARKAAPTGWAHDYLEDYLTYHTRYLALSCYTQHNTTFFEDCCRPMRATQTLEEDRKEYCRPNATALESAAARVSANAAAAKTATAQISAIPSDDAAPQWVQEAVAVATEEPAATQNAEYAAVSSEAAAAPAVTEATTTEEPKWTEEAKPTTTEKVEEPQWTEEAKPTTTEEKVEEPVQTEQASSGGSGTTYYGQATWYKQSEGAHWSNKGSCGRVSTDDEYVVAISTVGSSWGNTRCFENVVITNLANGKKVTAQIVDNCPSCRDANSLDLSPPAFAAIADLNDGITEISWQFA